jgi:hypothetical protein
MTAPKTSKSASTPTTPSPTPIYKPIEPSPQPIAAPIASTCQHEWKIFCSGRICIQCAAQDPPPPAPKQQEELTERQKLLRGFPLAPESSMSFDLVKWRNWRMH